MATSVAWGTKVINVLRADMLLVQSMPTEIRELDTDAFRLELKALEASEEGMPFIDTHTSNAPVTVGGVTLARTFEIINGYTVTFEDGQYAVNLSGTNNNIGDVTNVNQVSIRSSNSAGLTFSKEVEDQSFIDARVWIDVDNGQAGTQYPLGTPGFPVNNADDAFTIITTRNLPKRLHLRGHINIPSSVDITNYDLLGVSPSNSSITGLGAGPIVTGVKASGIAFSGAGLGDVTLFQSSLGEVSTFSGRVKNSGILGPVTLRAGTEWEFINCNSEVAGLNRPTINCNGIPNLHLELRNYVGGVTIENITGVNSEVSVDLDPGSVEIAATCTTGTVNIRGVGLLIDNSGPGCTVHSTGLSTGTSGLTPTESTQLASIDVLRKLMQNRMETNPTTGVLTIYDDDDTTVFLQGNIYEDVLAAQTYRGRGLERRDRLA